MKSKITKQSNQKILQEFLIEIRKEAPLTQEELAAQLDKPQSFVSKYESGERRLDVLELIHIFTALKLDPLTCFKNLLRRLEGK